VLSFKLSFFPTKIIRFVFDKLYSKKLIQLISNDNKLKSYDISKYNIETYNILANLDQADISIKSF